MISTWLRCLTTHSFPRTRDFLQSPGYRDDLEQLQKEVDSAVLALNTSMLVQSLAYHQGANNSVWSSDLEETGPIALPFLLNKLKAAHRFHCKYSVHIIITMEVRSQYTMFQLVSTCAGQKVVILVQWETLSAGNVAAN